MRAWTPNRNRFEIPAQNGSIPTPLLANLGMIEPQLGCSNKKVENATFDWLAGWPTIPLIR